MRPDGPRRPNPAALGGDGQQLIAADFDGQPGLELIALAAQQGYGPGSIVRFDGQPVASLPNNKNAEGYFERGYLPFAGDTNGDGRAEYFYATHNDGLGIGGSRQRLHFADISGHGGDVLLPDGEGIDGLRLLDCADLTGDGKPELLFPSGYYDIAGKRWQLLVRADWGQYEEQDRPAGNYGLLAIDTLWGDFDGDGKVELAALGEDYERCGDTTATNFNPSALWLFTPEGKVTHRECLPEEALTGPYGNRTGGMCRVLRTAARDHILLRFRHSVRISQ